MDDEESVFPEKDMDYLLELEYELQEQLYCSDEEGAGGASTRRYISLVNGLLLAARACRDEEDVAAVHELWRAVHVKPIPSQR